MEKAFEKRNLGIPATLLCVMAYIVGYAFTRSFAVLFAALLFAVVVFTFQFEDKVKTAIKQAYVIAFFVFLGDLFFEILNNILLMITISSEILDKVYNIINGIYNITVIVIFGLFVILAILNKEAKLNFISKMLGEIVPVKPQPVYQQAVYQQPMYQQPMQQPIQPMQQPIQQMQQPVQQPVIQSIQQPIQQSQQNVVVCPVCGMKNQPEAAFCAKCGTKLK